MSRPPSGNYFHGWSPDGKRLAFSANRGNGFDLFSISPDGGSERRLTTSPRADDAPQYSPDGRWIYFVSDRAGTRDIWRIPASGAGPGDSKAERITSDDREDAAPHPSPDGKWLFYLSYPARTDFNAVDRDVLIRRLPLPGDRSARPSPRHRPDRRRPRHARRPPVLAGWTAVRLRELRAPTADDSDHPVHRVRPDAPGEVPHRLTQIADAAERFLFGEMKRWKYPPAVSRLFRRNPDGTVEVTYVKGDRPASDRSTPRRNATPRPGRRPSGSCGSTARGTSGGLSSMSATARSGSATGEGVGCSRDGGSAVVNYDTIPGEIRPDLGLAMGFNSEYFLKGTIHELGHAFGLSHLGPDLSLNLGNSLMGPNISVYVERKYPNADQVYLTEASAAILWKHPVFSGTAKDRQRQPSVKLVDYKPRTAGPRTGLPWRASSSPICPRIASSSSTTAVIRATNTGSGATPPGSPPTAPSASPSTTPRGPTAISGSSSASTMAWSPAMERESSSTTAARSGKRTVSATGAIASEINSTRHSEHQDVGRHSTTKRPDDCRPDVCTSNPAARAISRNSARFRFLPPTNTIISSSGDGWWPSSGDTPPMMTTRPAGRAASAKRRRMAIDS